MLDANFTFLCDPIDRSDSPKAMRVFNWWACDWSCKNQQCECIIIIDFPTLFYHNLQTIYTNTTKLFTTTAEFNGLSSAIYASGIPHS